MRCLQDQIGGLLSLLKARYDEGFEARKRGALKSDNPFQSEGQKRAWSQGWDACQDQYEQLGYR